MIGLRRAALVAALMLSALASAGSALAASPGGNGLLAFAAPVNPSGSTRVHLYTVHADGSAVTDITPGLPAGRRVYVIAWSPDGGTLAYAIGEATGRVPTYSLSLIDADGSNPRQILIFRSMAATLSWTPDGTAVTFLV